MPFSPTLAGIAALFIWIFTATIIVQIRDIPPYALCAITNAGSFLLYCAIWLARGEDIRKKFIMPPKAYAVGSLLSIYIILWVVGLKCAPPLEANLLNYLWPILIVVFSALINKIKLRWFHLCGMGLGFIGICFLFLKPGRAPFQSAYTWGYIAAFASAFFWAFYSVLGRKIKLASDSGGIFLLFSGIIAAVLSMLFENWRPMLPQSLFWVVLFCLTRIGILFWDYSMKHGRPVLVISFSYFVPLLSTLALIVFTNAVASGSVMLAAGFILAGCLLTNADHLKPLLGRLQVKL